jgi:hypothetical protein
MFATSDSEALRMLVAVLRALNPHIVVDKGRGGGHGVGRGGPSHGGPGDRVIGGASERPPGAAAAATPLKSASPAAALPLKPLTRIQLAQMAGQLPGMTESRLGGLHERALSDEVRRAAAAMQAAAQALAASTAAHQHQQRNDQRRHHELRAERGEAIESAVAVVAEQRTDRTTTSVQPSPNAGRN